MARILVRKQVPYNVPVGGRCCDPVRSRLSNDELRSRNLVVGVGEAERWCDSRPLFQKAWPCSSPLAKRAHRASSETTPSLCMKFLAKSSLNMYHSAGRTLPHFTAFSYRPWSGANCSAPSTMSTKSQLRALRACVYRACCSLSYIQPYALMASLADVQCK